MADNRVQVDIVAENAQLKAKLAESEALLARAGQKGGKEAAGGIESVTKSASALGRVIRLITFPAVAITAAMRMASVLHGMLDPAKNLRNEFIGLAEDFNRGINSASIGLRFGESAQQAADITAAAARQVEAVTDRLETKLSDSGRIMRGKMGKILGIDQSDEKLVGDAKKSIAAIEAARDRAIENARIARERANRLDENAAELKVQPNDFDRLTLEGKQVYAEYLRKFNAEQTAEEKDHLSKMQELYNQYHAMRYKVLKEAIAREQRESLAAVQRAQTSGFGLNGGGPPSLAGTGTALQFLTDNIASFARTQGGGR